MEKTRIMIVGDGEYLQNSFINKVDNLQVVANVAAGTDAMHVYRQVAPDIIFVDMILKDMTGLEAIRSIREQDKVVKIVLLSMELQLEFLLAGIESGADGYLRKNSEASIFSDAIDSIKYGNFYVQMHPNIASR